MKIIRRLFTLTVVLCAADVIAQPTNCTALAGTLKEYNISSSSTSFLNSVFDQYCEQSGDSKSTSAGIGLDAVVKAIPIKFTGNYGSAAEAFKNFCKAYSSVVTSSERKFSYEEKIATKALETIQACISIAATGASISHAVPSVSGANFTLVSGPVTKLELQGLYTLPEGAVSCKGQLKGGLIPINDKTNIAINATQGIQCVRKSKVTSNGEQLFDEAVVTLITNVGNYSVFMPQDSRLPLSAASEISARLDRAEIASSSIANRTTNLEQAFGKERADVKYTFVNNGQSCPSGWSDKGIYGWIAQLSSADKNELGGGGAYIAGQWDWTHPRVCKR